MFILKILFIGNLSLLWIMAIKWRSLLKLYFIIVNMQQTISHADSGEKHLCLLLLSSPFNQLKRLQLIWKNIKHATGYTVKESTCTSLWSCHRQPSICSKGSSWFGRALDSGKDYFLLRFTKKVGMRELWLRTHFFKSKS